MHAYNMAPQLVHEAARAAHALPPFPHASNMLRAWLMCQLGAAACGPGPGVRAGRRGAQQGRQHHITERVREQDQVRTTLTAGGVQWPVCAAVSCPHCLGPTPISTGDNLELFTRLDTLVLDKNGMSVRTYLCL